MQEQRAAPRFANFAEVMAFINFPRESLEDLTLFAYNPINGIMKEIGKYGSTEFSGKELYGLGVQPWLIWCNQAGAQVQQLRVTIQDGILLKTYVDWVGESCLSPGDRVGLRSLNSVSINGSDASDTSDPSNPLLPTPEREKQHNRTLSPCCQFWLGVGILVGFASVIVVVAAVSIPLVECQPNEDGLFCPFIDPNNATNSSKFGF